ncbi:MAG: serine/threonine protein kinase [Gemmatimonadaceae bacterium]|nr:serine/threonine protein kinase [Gemmatimonadaceae bacterium]
MAPTPPDALFLAFQQAIAGRYSIDRELGRGGMGIVYLAREVHLDRLVAIKLLPPERAAEPAIRAQFLHEARTAASLSHPHIVPIHAVDDIDGFVFFVMAYVEGETLAQRVQARGPVSPREATRWLQEVAWALSYAHSRGVVHRDIKPDNILLERESGRALVADFGIAHALGTDAHGVHGTPEFMAPELALGSEPSAASDVYALGITAFFALSGQLPFTGPDAAAVLTQHCTQPVPPLGGRGLVVPRRLAHVVQQCLAKTPDARFASADAIATQLGAALEQRRELPAPLRAFVKRDGRADGAGTVLTLIASLGASIGAASLLGPVAGVVTLVGAGALGAAAFGVLAARRLLAQGYTAADVGPAFDAELELLREERSASPGRVLRWLERIARGVVRIGARTSLALVPFAIAGAVSPRFKPVASLLTFVAIGTGVTVLPWLVLQQMRRDIDIPFWRALWTGAFGRTAFAAARRVRGAAADTPIVTHRATELSLSLAAEQLFEQLPRETRAALGDVPAVLQQLQGDALALRKQLAAVVDVLADANALSDDARTVWQTERTQTEQRLQQTVAALEGLRLGLLRLSAGSATVASVTTHVDLARALSADVSRLADAHEETHALLGEYRPAPVQDIATSPV